MVQVSFLGGLGGWAAYSGQASFCLGLGGLKCFQDAGIGPDPLRRPRSHRVSLSVLGSLN